MITKTFYKSEFYNLIFLLITLIILRLPEFIYPDHLNYFYQNRSFSNSIFSNINAVFNSKLNLIISSVLLILQAFVLSYIIKKYNLTNKSSYIPEVLFLAIGSSLKAFSYLSPALICNFLLLLGTNVVFSTIKSDHQIKRLFYLGFICALGAIVYLPYIFITIAFIVSLYIIKTVYIKEPIAILIGFCTPYIMLFMLYRPKNKA